jgi:hypothetical protein
MWTQLIAGATVSAVNFAIHAVITALIVLATRHTARATSEMGMFARLLSLLTITVLALMCAHIAEITVWTGYYWSQALKLNNATYFEFAFENYTALGYGDALPADGNRLIAQSRRSSAGRSQSSSRSCGWLNCDSDDIARLPFDEDRSFVDDCAKLATAMSAQIVAQCPLSGAKRTLPNDRVFAIGTTHSGTDGVRSMLSR